MYHNLSSNGGGWKSFVPSGKSQTLATALDAEGYRTALVGKYLNGWGEGGDIVPPGWDDFIAFHVPRYYNFKPSRDGR